ncbi:MAG TPA: MBL fold metallo-hydrolase [Kofleriaceae bacterium]|nr:MBL fold metallo-hydrolase [Kofleriaceae bacterium]
MLVSVEAGPYTVRGLSVGGVYTALQVPELGVCFDVGLAPRTFASTRRLFLSHGHVDHLGALATMLGIRGLMSMKRKLEVFMPAEIVADVTGTLERQSAMQRYDLSINAVGMRPGDELELRNDLRVRAFRTLHPVPSLGYQFLRRNKKLRPELRGLPGPEIQERRLAGDDIFDEVEVLELAYATDTLAKVLDNDPTLYQSRVLILECTFLDQRKTIESSRAGCHIHLDELIERADLFENEHLVLMHFSQIYRPDEIRGILAARCPPALLERIHPLAPEGGHWPG